MRTRRLCGLTLAVLLAHAIAWQMAVARWPRFAARRAGVHRLALVSVPQRRLEPSAAPEPVAVALEIAAAPSPALRPPTSPRAPSPQRIATGVGGTRRSTPPEAVAWPTYATRPPPSITLRYALAQGAAASSASGSAEIEWRREADAFSLRVATRVDDRLPREWQSVGGFDAAGLAPVRLVERERGRDKRAINFDHDGARVRFSGASGTLAIAPGAQDRWSWVAQLAAIVEANESAAKPVRQWDLQVAGLRGELERWTFRVLPLGALPVELASTDKEPSSSSERASALLHVLRAPSRPYDLRIEAWLSPSLHHLPAGLRMSAPPGAWSLSLWLRNS